MIPVRKSIFALVLVCAGVALAAEVRDMADINRAHNHILEALHDLEVAQKANHYDMAGHAAKAERLLKDAEHELKEAAEAAAHAK